MTTIFAALGFTRDDFKWTLGIVASIVVGLASMGDAVTQVGIPAAFLPYLRLGALIVGIVSAKNATSGLSGKNDPPAGSVSVSSFKPLAVLFLALAIGGTSMAVTGCTKTAPNVTPVTQSAQLAKVLNAVQKIGGVVATVQQDEIALFQAGTISAMDHAAIKKGFEEASAAVLASIDGLQQATAATNVQQLVSAVSSAVKQLAQTLGHLSTKQAQQLGGWLDTASALIDVALAS